MTLFPPTIAASTAIPNANPPFVCKLSPVLYGSGHSLAHSLTRRLPLLACSQSCVLDRPPPLLLQYIRVLGFLYIRYTCTPKAIWSWIESFLADEEEFFVQGASTAHGLPAPRLGGIM